MGIRLFWQQLLRNRKRTLLNIVLLMAVTAFFVMSLNLYRNSEKNIQLANETYSTIAVMELYGDLDVWGSLTDSFDTDYLGYLPAQVRGYDLSSITEASSVVSYDRRLHFAACIEGEIAYSPLSVGIDGEFPIFKQDLIRFTINEAEPVIIQRGGRPQEYAITVLESASGSFVYGNIIRITSGGWNGVLWDNSPRAADAAHFNQNAEVPEGSFLLESGVEYLASVGIASCLRLEDGRWEVKQMSFRPDLYWRTYEIDYNYDQSVGQTYLDSTWDEQPFWIHRWSEVQADPELYQYYQRVGEACRISAQSFGIIATDDVMSTPALHLGTSYIAEGRQFNQDEYTQGANVCMVSQKLAMAHGWSVGDTLDMSFYNYDYFVDGEDEDLGLFAYYTKENEEEGFLDQGVYTIVGIYASRPAVSGTSLSPGAANITWNAIFVPKASVTAPEAEQRQPLSGALFSIRLENGTIEAFQKEMEQRGVAQSKAEGYEARFSFFDQGYSTVQSGLQQLSGMARLLLILSAALLVCTLLLISFFFVHSQKQNMGILRMLGGTKARSFAAVMACVLLLTVLGTGLGAVVGHSTADRVGRSVLLDMDETPEEHLAYSAFLAAGAMPEISFAAEAQGSVTTAACAVSVGLFLGSSALLCCWYLRCEPRALLPKSKK